VAGASAGITIVELGRESLRNVADPVLLLRARGSEPEDDGELPIDPVCRMAVEPVSSAGVLHNGGADYHFCSIECVRAFAADPDRYLSVR